MQLLWENFQFVIILKESLDYESAWTMDTTTEIYRSLRKGSMEQSNYGAFDT